MRVYEAKGDVLLSSHSPYYSLFAQLLRHFLGGRYKVGELSFDVACVELVRLAPVCDVWEDGWSNIRVDWSQKFC